MVDTQNLRVSLTKNGYIKIAIIVEEHSSWEMLQHVSGSHPGVRLVVSQVANILCADPDTGVVPGLWDEVRQYDRQTIRAFVFVAILFSHHRLIQAFIDAGNGTPRGTLLRSDFESEKEYTNLVFSLAEVDACPYDRGADQISYDLGSVTTQLQGVGQLVAKLLKRKLIRCGWRDPDEFFAGADLPLLEECRAQGFHKALGLTYAQFSEWLTGRRRRPR
jgi:hypothetical protein